MQRNGLFNRQRFATSFFLLTSAAIVCLCLNSPVHAANIETVLYNFPGSGGSTPMESLLRDGSGNLFGVTFLGGSQNAGTLFELSPQGGSWAPQTLYSFRGVNDGPSDGIGPSGRLIMDGAGNLYGVTEFGGTHSGGTVFKLAPGPNGTWTETILWNFAGTGNEPTGGLTLDSLGNLYGTTTRGGGAPNTCSHGCGVAFKLTPAKKGKWKFTSIYRFLGARQNDGQTPNGDLVFDAFGNLYGTTGRGGTAGGGTAFELSPQPSGLWSETVLHSFGTGSDGLSPVAGVILDQAGNLYGTTFQGGDYSSKSCTGGCGIVFQLSPGGSGWTENILYSFAGGSDGSTPASVLVLNAGHVYGTTLYGGSSGLGSVFELSSSGGTWAESLRHSFSGAPNDGQTPSGGIVLDGAGDILAQRPEAAV
jgi:uncharacterized repeat protein (TIGR03803 family)